MSTDAIFGGRQVAVRVPGGEPIAVTVRVLKISELPRYFELLEQEEKLAEFLTGKDAAFIASLEPASLLDIVDAGHDLNFQIAQRWAERRARHVAALAPVVKQMGLTDSPSSARTAG